MAVLVVADFSAGFGAGAAGEAADGAPPAARSVEGAVSAARVDCLCSADMAEASAAANVAEA